VAGRKTIGYCSLMEHDDWPRRIAHSVGRQVNRLRNSKRPKMSAQQLADECSRLGSAISRSTIAKLESGSRAFVTLDEVLVMAVALDVPPALLIAAVGTRQDAEVLPGQNLSPWDAARWFAGAVSIEESDGKLSAVPAGADDLLVRFYMHDDLVQEILDTPPNEGYSDPVTGQIDYTRRRLNTRLKADRARMRGEGIVPPSLPAELRHLDDDQRAM
jgi:transcriptional regulator with XRE-family HTH domain